MKTHDTSVVWNPSHFHSDGIDAWFFECESYSADFETEEQACAEQRKWRKENGCDEISGERIA